MTNPTPTPPSSVLETTPPEANAPSPKLFTELELFHRSPITHFQEFVERQRLIQADNASPEEQELFEKASQRVLEALQRNS